MQRFSLVRDNDVRASAASAKWVRWASLFFLSVGLLFTEWMSRAFQFGFLVDYGTLLMFLSAVASGLLVTALLCCLPRNARFPVAVLFLGLVAAYDSFYLIYYDFFQTPFVFSSIVFADAVTQFFDSTVSVFFSNLWKVLILFVPMGALLLFGRKNYALPKRFATMHQALALMTAVAITVYSLAALVPSTSRKRLIYMRQNAALTFQTFGIGIASMTDLWQTLFGAPEYVPDDTDPVVPVVNSDPQDVTYEPNTLPIDFDALIEAAPNDKIRRMHEYFSAKPATDKNAYTGLFEGKNLIFLTLEGFCDKAIDKDRTPLLYQMSTEGFVFRNFYDSLWGGSTASGEYSNMTGNFYNTANCLKTSGSTLTYSALGNLFRTNGFLTYAYHNHTYDYYNRDLSHPNFGYQYKAIGNGLSLPSSCWPRSDLELSQATAAEYIQAAKKSGQPFHAYYMTVSGHASYTFVGNSMSTRHKSLVGNLSCSDGIKAYFACQYEVELMLEDLIEQLDDAGMLEDTVFAMCCDHYPYALSDSELAELYGLPENNIRNNFDLYRNGFLLWSASMKEPVVVDTPCSSIDMVPTLANLFGLSFDSRLITGTDILSTTENLVVLNTASATSYWNWITSYGTYVNRTGTFTPTQDCPLSGDELDAYIQNNCRRVEAMRTYSMAILETDYYSYIFNEDFSLKATQKSEKEKETK